MLGLTIMCASIGLFSRVQEIRLLTFQISYYFLEIEMFIYSKFGQMTLQYEKNFKLLISRITKFLVRDSNICCTKFALMYACKVS